MRSWLIILACLLGLSAASVHAASSVRLRLVATVNHNPPRELSPVEMTARDHCRLSVILERGDGQNGKLKQYFSDFTGAARLGRAEVAVAQWPAAEPATVRWFKVEPRLRHTPGRGHDPTVPDFLWYTNAYCPQSPKHQQWLGYDTIEYVKTEIPALAGRWTIDADAHPTDPHYDLYDGLGVMRYAAEVTLGAQTFRTPGPEAAGELGISDQVFTLAVRRDDTYLGYVTSYFNVPGVFGSVGPQVDRYLGVDCADLVVGAYRKWKKSKLEYTNVNGLFSVMKPLCDAVFLGERGVFADKALTRPARVPFREGAAITFDYPGTVEDHYDHVGLLYRDNGNGILDGEDLFLQCGPMEPRVDPLRCQVLPNVGPTRIRVLEWK